MQLKWSGKNRMQLVPNSWLQYTVCLHPVCLIWICQDFSSAGGGYWLGSPLFSIPYTCMKSLLCAASVWTDLYLAACAFFFSQAVFQQPLSNDVWAAVCAQSTFHTVLYSAVMWQHEAGSILYALGTLDGKQLGGGWGGSSKETMLHIKTESFYRIIKKQHHHTVLYMEDLFTFAVVWH